MVKTTCPYCGVGCGIIIENDVLRGDPDHPANFGKLCGKGLALLETIGLEDRLLTAKVDGVAVSNEAAIALVASKFKDTIEKYGRDSVAFYVSGQLLTEDYYVANKLMKGYIGTSNIDSNSRLCMASSVAGYKRAFGADFVPVSYEDCEKADLVVLVGSNLAWCHPVLFQRIKAAGVKMITIDPHKTMTARESMLHLAIKPDTDIALFKGLVGEIEVKKVAEICDISLESIQEFYQIFHATQKVVTIWSQGINQSEQGVDSVNAIINAHLLTDKHGREGMGAFSITGQPNAMGGREVGALANMLAAHIEFSEAELVQEFWQSPTIANKAGLKAVALFEAVKTGKIKAIWIMATNPAVSLPSSDEIAKALKACPFVVVSDMYENTDTAKFAHVLLPALGWGEKQGTVTNSERCISKQNRFLPSPANASQDWQWVCEVSKKMGFNGFDYKNETEIFKEFQALSGYKNNGSRVFDISTISEYPARWGGEPLEGKVIEVEIPKQVHNEGIILNTGRNRDQWHTMTRTGKSARLSAHLAEPFVKISPALALKHAIKDADIVEINGIYARALITDETRDDTVFMPIHWSKVNSSHSLNNVVRVNADKLSGQPALKSASVTLKKANMQQFGFGVFSEKPEIEADYFAISKIKNGYRAEWANLNPKTYDLFKPTTRLDDDETCHQLLCEDGVLKSAVYLSNKKTKLARAFIEEQLGKLADIKSLLIGFPLSEAEDKGAIICACYQIGKHEIIAKTENAKQAGTNCGSCLSEVKMLLG